MSEEKRRAIKQPSDLNEVRTVISGILGKFCTATDLGYGEELYICIGNQLTQQGIRTPEIPLYEWELASRGTYWELAKSKRTIVTSDNSPDQIIENIRRLKGTRITDFKVTFPQLALIVIFNNDYELAIRPTLEDATQELAYWQLFTPTMMLLEVGPGPFWSYTRADIP